MTGGCKGVCSKTVLCVFKCEVTSVLTVLCGGESPSPSRVCPAAACCKNADDDEMQNTNKIAVISDTAVGADPLCQALEASLGDQGSLSICHIISFICGENVISSAHLKVT